MYWETYNIGRNMYLEIIAHKLKIRWMTYIVKSFLPYLWGNVILIHGGLWKVKVRYHNPRSNYKQKTKMYSQKNNCGNRILKYI